MEYKEKDCQIVAARLERLSQLGREAANKAIIENGAIDSSHLLERCEEIDLFLESRCLDFGLGIMGNILNFLVSDFAATAGGLAVDLVGFRSGEAKSVFGEALMLCEEILKEGRPTLH